MFKKYFTQSNLIYLILILAVGVFLRIYKIEINYYFTGELGKELLYMYKYASSHTLPLIGMTTSHEWLSYGPFYYWVMIPIFNIFSGNPFILFWSGLVVSVLGLISIYLVFKKIINDKVALLSTLIAAFSPIFIWQTRLSKLHIFFFLIIPVITYLLYLLWSGKKKWIIPTGLLFGLLFSFHFSQIPLFGVVILLFLIKRRIYKIRDWIYFGVGLIIPNIPLIWQDRNLALWLPYRVANMNNKDPIETLKLLTEYFGKSVFWNNHFWIIGFVIFLAILAHYIIKNRHNFAKEFLPFYLISSISLMLVANILHGAPPIHYFLPMFTMQTVLYAIYLAKFKYWPLVFIPIVVMNLVEFTYDPVFYKNFSGLVKNTDMVSYSTQNAVTSFMVANSKNTPMSIKRIGPFDYFPEQYSQNYKYLIIWKGGNLVENSGNIYTITEDVEKGEVSVQK
jgi:4-amino-4-deoxy-L-arabinose transferase-like glycosyltransferase